MTTVYTRHSHLKTEGLHPSAAHERRAKPGPHDKILIRRKPPGFPVGDGTAWKQDHNRRVAQLSTI